MSSSNNHGIVINEHGDASVLSYTELPMPEAAADQIVVRNAAAGLNFIDTYHRSGLYKVPLPYTLGREGAGEVVAVGVDAAAAGWAVGDKAAYVLTPGAYAQYTAVATSRAAKLPAGVTEEQGAAVMLQGLTAHYLAHSSYKVKAGETVLVHAAAGGTGLLLAQMCKNAGATVIGTVSTDAKAELATSVGKVDHVIKYSEDSVVDAIDRITAGVGVDVVFDGVGAATFDASMTVLKPRGTMVSFGNASGAVPPVNILASLKGSKYLTRPSLGDFISGPGEFDSRLADLFAWIAAGDLTVTVGATFPLESAADAHRALESRGTTGKILLVPGGASE
ncbi:uncharacterized protein AMSG_00917 [Thecamonas trahens ATCC 50062]|uniref:Probable quinone oxidoreductase n=1 Tax=Thecamonas trahens ATCC 50062 TaxID=461836 RepID=A0A0L0DIC0_THETB|nr:hypothetical protein AMSG_00917 [Thecamonas trahens ATCC 50062]KNC52089.1 hypothetical protein AMSG_00917 [Thecamonas trahens ATCC 50062]|eukprot:XP_013762094.1 hypothetical protein AMSG_00917 [Thecamonas trahens ATCC 50062]